MAVLPMFCDVGACARVRHRTIFEIWNITSFVQIKNEMVRLGQNVIILGPSRNNVGARIEPQRLFCLARAVK